MKKSLAILALIVFTNMVRAEPCGVSCNGGWASGTTIEGASAGKTYVVTNKHVARMGGKQILLDGKTYDTRLVALHPTSDLALFEVNATLKTSKLADTDPTRGSVFSLQGYGVNSGGFDKVRQGTVSHCRFGGLSTQMFISPGDSGSGLIAEGNLLIGVIWGCQGQGGGPGVGIPVSAVKELLPKRKTYRF